MQQQRVELRFIAVVKAADVMEEMHSHFGQVALSYQKEADFVIDMIVIVLNKFINRLN